MPRKITGAEVPTAASPLALAAAPLLLVATATLLLGMLSPRTGALDRPTPRDRAAAEAFRGSSAPPEVAALIRDAQAATQARRRAEGRPVDPGI